MFPRYLLATTAWAIAGFVAMWFARNTAVGPTVLPLTQTHGLHEGDVVVLVGASFCAAAVSVAALRQPTR
jgi:hypothetical protein